MKDDQQEIYYVTGDYRETIERNPNLEYFKKHDIEVLFLTDPVDIFVIPSIHEYDKKPLKSIDKADIEMAKTDEEGQEGTLNESVAHSLLDTLKEILIDKVEDVIASKRLVDSAVTLVVGKEGMDIQELIRTINHARQKLFEIRKTRVHPLKDDKILTAWNGLMIAALAKGYQVLGEQSYIDSATNAADFIVQNLTKHDGTLLRRYRDGDVAYSGYLNDYAFFVWGLIELYEATFNIAYLEEALKINHVMISNFWDNEDKGLFFSGTDNAKLIFSNKEIYDGAIPSGNSVAALNFLRLGRLTGDTNLDEKVDELIRGFSSQIKSHPMAYTHFMSALDFAVGPVVEIIIAGNPSDEILNRMIKKIRTPFLPNKVVLMKPENQKNSRLVNLLPDIEKMKSIESQPTVYLCEGYACKSPITSIEGLQIAIDQLTLKIHHL